jgi:hypothetical protein
MYTVGTCFIRGAGNHAATVGVAAHDHRLATQLWVTHPLSRDEEGIQFDMQYPTFSHLIHLAATIIAHMF